jgi:AcrR family transcriptional regulator
MESIAKKLGLRTPSFYHYFPGGQTEMILAVAKHS